MNKSLLALLLVGVISSVAGLRELTASAQAPPADNEPPVRLKKKKPRNDDKPMVEPDKPEEKQKDEKDKKPELREGEPVTPQEEEKEVLQRVVTNVHRVNERLAKNDLGEATQQTQRDILKDLESLIQRNENPPSGGQQDQNNNSGAGDNRDNNDRQQGGGQQGQKKQGGGGKAQGQTKGGPKSQSGRNGQSGASPGAGSNSSSQQQRNGGQPSSGKRAGKDDKTTGKSGGKNGRNGNGGGGGDKDDRVRDKNADLDKHGVWGHLPQTLRAQMDAYSNPQPFIPKYDDLIKRYYKTISEQSRRKGE